MRISSIHLGPNVIAVVEIERAPVCLSPETGPRARVEIMDLEARPKSPNSRLPVGVLPTGACELASARLGFRPGPLADPPRAPGGVCGTTDRSVPPATAPTRIHPVAHLSPLSYNRLGRGQGGPVRPTTTTTATSARRLIRPAGVLAAGPEFLGATGARAHSATCLLPAAPRPREGSGS